MGNVIKPTIVMFETPDLVLAALLGASGLPLVRSYINQRDKVIFCFPASQDQSELVKAYLAGETTVDPTKLIRVYGYLKSEIFRLREGEQGKDPS